METWGDKPKSQVDNTLIDDEIDAKIQDHDDDPDSHLDVGQALQSHKASEIIDHIAGSIIEDKIGTGEISDRCITSDQIIGKDIRTAEDVGAGVDGVKMIPAGIEMWQGGEIKVKIPVSGDADFRGNVGVDSLTFHRVFLAFSFESIDAWDKLIGGGAASLVNGVGHIHFTTDGVVGDKCILSAPSSSYFRILMAKNPFFECYALSFDKNSGDFFLAANSVDIFTDDAYFGFRYDASLVKMYAVYKQMGVAEVKTDVTSYLTGSDVSNGHVFRAEISFSELKARFYINGVKCAEITIYNEDADVGNLFACGIKSDIGNNDELLVYSLYISQLF